MWPERKTQSDTENSVCAEHTKMEWMNCTTQLNIFATTMGLIFWTSAQPTVFSLRGHFVPWRALAAWFTVWKRLVLCNQLKAAANSLYIRPSMANAVQSIPIPEYGELPLLKHNFTCSQKDHRSIDVLWFIHRRTHLLTHEKKATKTPDAKQIGHAWYQKHP